MAIVDYLKDRHEKDEDQRLNAEERELVAPLSHGLQSEDVSDYDYGIAQDHVCDRQTKHRPVVNLVRLIEDR